MKIYLILFLFISSSTLHSQELLQQSQLQFLTELSNTPYPGEFNPGGGPDRGSAPPVSLKIKVEDYPQITVTVGKDKAILCELDSVSKLYLCLNEGKTTLVKYTPFGFSVISKDSNNVISSPVVNQVESGEKTLYFTPEASRVNLSSPEINTYKDLHGFFSYYEMGEIKEITKSSPAFQHIFDSFQELKNKIKKDYIDSNYIVELENGQKVSCSRGSKANGSPSYTDREKKEWEELKCGSFKCESLEVNGKKYDVTMLYDSDPLGWGSHSVHLIDKNGLGPEVKIKKIISSSSSNTIVDNSKRLENLHLFKDPGSSATVFSSNMNEKNKKLETYKGPGFLQFLDANKKLCTDDNNSLSLLEEAKNKFFTEIAELELVEFIEVLNNGSLTSNFIDPSQALTRGCLYQGVYLNEDAAKNLDKLKKNIHPETKSGDIISMERATELFDKATRMDDIAWKFKQDGCYARAHLMARRFEEEGIRVDKVWIKGDLHIPDSEPVIEWNFHVAPIVYVNDGNGRVQKMVIDPSLFSKPVTVEEWDKKISKKTLKGSVVTAFPYPENAALVERSALAFSSSDPYLPFDKINMSEQDKMNKANKTMKNYKPLETK